MTATPDVERVEERGEESPAMPERKFIDLPGHQVSAAPYSLAVVDGEDVWLAGQIAADDPVWRARQLNGPATIEDETATALGSLSRVLAAAGLDMTDVVRVTIYMTDLALFDRMNSVYTTFFRHAEKPARTCVGVASLLAGAQIEIDCIARKRRRES